MYISEENPENALLTAGTPIGSPSLGVPGNHPGPLMKA